MTFLKSPLSFSPVKRKTPYLQKDGRKSRDTARVMLSRVRWGPSAGTWVSLSSTSLCPKKAEDHTVEAEARAPGSGLAMPFVVVLGGGFLSFSLRLQTEIPSRET